jgi:hypothetical protein
MFREVIGSVIIANLLMKRTAKANQNTKCVLDADGEKDTQFIVTGQ